MNKRFIYVIIILVILIGACIWEQVMVNNYLSNIKEKVYYITEFVKDKTDINSKQMYDLVVDLDSTWEKYEENLCFLVNHKEIADLGVELTKMKIYVVENNVTEFKASLAQVLYYAEGYEHVMGITLQNLL